MRAVNITSILVFKKDAKATLNIDVDNIPSISSASAIFRGEKSLKGQLNTEAIFRLYDLLSFTFYEELH